MKKKEAKDPQISMGNEFRILNLVNNLPECNTLDYELCIITKGNRKPSLLDCLENFGETKINVFIDKYEKELYEWLDKPNVNKIYVPFTPEQSSAAAKRLFVQQTMGAKKYWVFEDDLKNGIIAIEKREGKTSRRKIKVPLSKMCRIVEILSKNETNWTMAGFTYSEIGVAFCSYDNLIVQKRVDNAILFDGKLMQEKNVWYAGDPLIVETADVYIKTIRKGLRVLCCPFGTWEAYTAAGKGNSIASSTAKHTKYLAGSYIKWGDIYSFRKKTGPHKIEDVFHYSKVNKPLTWNYELLDICKKVVISGDPQLIIDYIEKNK